MVAERPAVHTGLLPKLIKMDSGVSPDSIEDVQPCNIIKYSFSRDGSESKICTKPNSPEKEKLYRLHKSRRYGINDMADEIGRFHLPAGDGHPRALDTEEGDIDHFQDAKPDK